MKYYLWALGCAMNKADAERIAAVLEALGYEETTKEKEANLIVVVACSVRQTAIDRIYGKSKGWNKRKKTEKNFRTVLSGCVLDKDRSKMLKIFDLVFMIDDLGKLPGLLGEELAEEKTVVLGQSGEYLGIAPAYQSSFRAYVPIMTGCDNFCSYCAVPYTRGREKSRPRAEVVAEIRDLVARGFREITILGQNVNSYANDFCALLSEVDSIPGDYRVYFYSNHPKDISDALIKLMPSLVHFPPYIHLPLQSGSNDILRKMNRHYSKEAYLALVAKLKKEIPNLTLTTDIMVGYPGETEEDFRETLAVAQSVGYDMIFSAQYSPRPGTISAKLKDDIPKAEKKKREKELITLFANILAQKNKLLVGTELRVLIDGKKSGLFYGRTEGYKVVELKSDQALELGHFYEVKIVDGNAWKLIGRFVS